MALTTVLDRQTISLRLSHLYRYTFYMGGCSSAPARSHTFRRIPDNYGPVNCNCIQQLQADLKTSGLENSELIVFVDFTKSNEWNGGVSFGGASSKPKRTTQCPNSKCTCHQMGFPPHNLKFSDDITCMLVLRNRISHDERIS